MSAVPCRPCLSLGLTWAQAWAPCCWHSLTRARGEAKLRAPVRGALGAVPCLCSAVHVALPFLTGGQAGISQTPEMIMLGRYVVALDQLTVYRQSSTL